ncbi:site-2 protease family protein [bacterium]|nr:site-2 protease family protein [bacterium]
MKWSWKIARLAGIDVYIHNTFFLLVAWFGYHYWKTEGTMAAALEGMVYIVALFSCVVMHEFGHALTARRYGITTRHITLLPIGGVATMEKLPQNPIQEIKVALAGPAVNIAIAAILWLWLAVNHIEVTEEQLLATGGPFVFRLMIVNIFLAVFNLLPAFPMDGGRVLRAAFALRIEHHRATAKAAAIGQNFAIIFGVMGLFYNPFLLLIAIFLWFGAAMENQAEQTKHSLGDAIAADAILTEFYTLSINDPLSKAIEYTLASNQKDFPVSDQQSNTHTFVGALTQIDLLQALQQHGENTPISALNLRKIHTVDYNAPIQSLINDIQSDETHMFAVKKNAQTVGIINLQNVMELISIHEAINNRRLP